MRVLLLTPGTGSFFCGSCLRDNDLALALRELGHDATIAPLYLPFALEDMQLPEAEAEVHMGGINVYLQQKLRWMRHLPGFLARLIDSPKLLRFVARRANMTDASAHGEMTLSMLRGEEGRQLFELEKLVEWMQGLERPDVVILSNVMLVGLARRIREVVGCPVLCTMQGEAPFLDALPEPQRAQCWQTLAQRAGDLDRFLPVSAYTASLMGERMQLDVDQMRVVPNGISLDEFVVADRQGQPTTIGYLARMCPDKGLPLLVVAFIELRKSLPELRLLVGGVLLRCDHGMLEDLKRSIRAAGAEDYVEFRPNMTRAEKLQLLQDCDIFSVPATYGESFGLYLLEAMASGLPVAQPRCAAFPELIEATGGGLLCAPDDAQALAACLGELLGDLPAARAMGLRARQAVLKSYSAQDMARAVIRVAAECGTERQPSSELV
jgi:glycosyltransferase involved in cell wall biosynthesis